MDEEQEARNAISCGANHGALRIISRRVEERTARAILVDLHREGLITIVKYDWDVADGLMRALKRAAKHRSDE